MYCAGDDFLDPKITPIKNLKGKIKHELRFKKRFLAVRKCDFENEFGSGDLHSSQLIEMVVSSYLDIRLYSYAKFYQKTVNTKEKIGARQQLNKLVLFKGL